MTLDPPTVPPEGDDLAWALPRLADLAHELGCTLATELLPADCGGYFQPATRTIALNAANSTNHQVKTLVHEYADVVVMPMCARTLCSGGGSVLALSA